MELARTLSKVSRDVEEIETDQETGRRDIDKLGEFAPLEDAAAKWAGCCVRNFRDELLRKGLQISESVANFLAELEASRTS